MFIMGLDIGYSNLKVAFGNNEQARPEFHIMPVGAGPEEYLPRDIIGRKKGQNGLVVNVNGETYVAGVEPWEFSASGWKRELHQDYPGTKNYKALFYAALLMTGQKEVDLLVTGLPVFQYFDLGSRKKLQNMLVGTHQVTSEVAISVKNAKIIGQPIGAYVEALMNEEEDFVEAISRKTALVFDVGFFSVDWVLVKNQRLLPEFSGTSIYATSKLIEKTSYLISQKYGRAPEIDDIESAIRQGENYIYIFMNKVDIHVFMEQAAATVSDIVLREIRQSVRSQDIDLIIITGGGARYYEKMLRQHFPRSTVYRSKDTVGANAKGFWFYGTSILD